MELLEKQAPKTVANFLNYVENDAYTLSIFHRSVPGFVIQGGGFRIVASNDDTSLIPVETLDPVENEFGISNTRGTVAMAKLDGDPNSATSQWFVNLADNSGSPAHLDTQNGGFTVFGRILYEGMQIFDAIENLPTTDLGGPLTDIPVIDFNESQLRVENLVRINDVKIHDVTGIFNDDILSFAVDTGDNNFFDVKLQLVSVEPNIVFELDFASILSLSSAPANSATFSAQDKTLLIPSVIVNETTIVNNVVMSLTDPAIFQFTLVSME